MKFWFPVLILLALGCRRDKGIPEYGGFPKEVGWIMQNRCAAKACHNSQGAEAAAGLDLNSWEALFRGSRNNSAVIPYRADHSFLAFSIDVYHNMGPMLEPVMPLNQEPLSMEQVMDIEDWINRGAPNNRGEVKFSDRLSSPKIFVLNQGCDLVDVFDAATKLRMRVLDVGNSPATESPHDIIVSPDGKYFYVSFYISNLFQKYSTENYAKLAEMDLNDYSWHAIAISGNSKVALLSHLSESGKAKLVDLESMKVTETFIMSNPHGVALNYDASSGYVSCQQGNFIYKLNLADPQNHYVTEVPLQTGETPNLFGTYKPYAISWFPDYSRYAVTCQGTNELRIFSATKDSLLKVIKTSGVPQLMSFSKKFPWMFVTCMSDTANSQSASQVNVINYQTMELVASEFTGNQPRGLAVDDANNCVWVANRNIKPVGWVPHHSTSCRGTNGYITIIDMNTLKLIPGWKAEVSVDPYGLSMRQ